MLQRRAPKGALIKLRAQELNSSTLNRKKEKTDTMIPIQPTQTYHEPFHNSRLLYKICPYMLVIGGYG